MPKFSPDVYFEELPMKTSVILAILILGAGLLVWVLSRSRKKAQRRQPWIPGHGPELLRSVVPSSEKHADPYPYIFVNSDGTARELHAKEREYLETPFRPTDAGQPYVKGSYAQKNGWGEIRGFMDRSELPAEVSLRLRPLPIRMKQRNIQTDSYSFPKHTPHGAQTKMTRKPHAGRGAKAAAG